MRFIILFSLASVVFVSFRQRENVTTPSPITPEQLSIQPVSIARSNPDESPVDWKKDPVCKAVFFGVLEGLYNDGVADDVVDNIIGARSDLTDTKKLKERMKRSFVMDCPLCQPTFEAFLAYQNRPTFNDGSDERSFGDGLDDETRTGLLSDQTQSRLTALKPVVQKWIKAKFEQTNLSPTEIEQWKTISRNRFAEGKSKLIKLITDGNEYREWSGYWGCAACNGMQDAAESWKPKR